MAYFNNAFYKTFVVDSGIVTAGTATQLLAKGQLGLVTDANWQTVVPGNALAANTLAYLVQGSLYDKDKIGNNPGHGGYQESVKSKGINPRYISRVWEQDATVASQATAQICVASDCAPCGQNLFIRMDVKGSPALRFLNHNAYAIGDSSGDAAANGASLPGLCCITGQAYLDPALALAGAMQMLLHDPLIKPFAMERGSGMLVTKNAASPQTDFDGVATFAAITTAGTTYVAGTNLPTTASASGLGLTVDITVNGAGAIQTVTLNNPGHGYAAAEVITIPGGSGTGALPVATITADSGSFTFSEVLNGPYVPSTDPVTDAVTACATTVGAYVSTKFGDCSFDTRDHFNAEPVEIILSLLDETGDPCNDCGVATMTAGSMQQTQGEEVIRALILSERYRQSPYNQGNADSARIREIEMADDLLGFVDRNVTYKAYYVQHVVPRFNNPSGVFDNDQYVCQIFVKDTDTAGKTAVETILDGLIAMANTAGQNIAMETFTL
tara:strand:- start:3589 stop:5082 length:1494 start_codon:yes stop_codon:yes gene_type:complete